MNPEDYKDSELRDLAMKIKERLDAGDERMGKIEKSLEENTRITRQVLDSTTGLVEAYEGVQEAFAWFCRLAKVFMWCVNLFEKLWKPVLVITFFLSLMLTRKIPDWLIYAWKLIV